MAFKLVVVLACVAYASAGLIGAPAAVAYSSAPAVSHVSYASPVVSYGAPQVPAITTQSQNILRSPGNLAQVSTYSKTIDTPFSSVSKSDVRVSNPGYVSAVAAPAISYSAPYGQYGHAVAAPLVAKTYAAPAVATHGLLGVAYSAAPAVSHMTYSNGLGITYGW